MQERQVTVGGVNHPLPDPFFVLATQNPIEQEGTYPLPEAQLDRFMLQILIGYPTADEEAEIVRRTTGAAPKPTERVLSGEDVRAIQALVREVPVADHVVRYALRLVRATRQAQDATSSNAVVGGQNCESWTMSVGAQGPVQVNSWCWPQRLARYLRARQPRRLTMCARLRSQFSGIGCN